MILTVSDTYKNETYFFASFKAEKVCSNSFDMGLQATRLLFDTMFLFILLICLKLSDKTASQN